MDFSVNPKELIYHEKQQGSLCAVHCLNNLLQGNYFTAVDLGKFADDLDEAERIKMAEGGQNSEEYRKFIQAPSQNKDDTGYFSIQVIERALSNLNLEMIPYNSKSSTVALSFQENPTAAQAYICHLSDHWFTVRKFGTQWINLNSLKSKPEPISDTYLSLYLKQLQMDGYSIFIITGTLLPSEADRYLSENPLPRWYFEPARTTSSKSASKVAVPEDTTGDANYQAALQESFLNSMQEEQRQIELALKMSLEQDK